MEELRAQLTNVDEIIPLNQAFGFYALRPEREENIEYESGMYS